MGRLLDIATGQGHEELRALFRAATKDAIYARMDAEFAKLPAARDAAVVAWLQRCMDEQRWATIGDRIMDYALCRDDTVRQAGRAALEPDVERLVAAHLPKFISLNL